MVGASLACALGGSSLRVGVVEAVPLEGAGQPSYDDRTVALAFGSRRILEGIGVWPMVEQRGAVPIERIHISDRGRFGFTRLAAAESGLPALGYVVENRVLGAALYGTLRRHENVTLLTPASMAAVDFAPEAAAVDVVHAGKRARLSARLVVAADGAGSPVRAAAGIEAARTDYEQTAIVTNVTTELPHANTAYERFTESGPLALLPMSESRTPSRAPAALGQPAHRCAVVWSARAGEVGTVLGWDDAEFLARLQERFGERLGRFARVGRRQAYPLFLTRVREHVRPRLVLIGNAAHTVHPVAGQGFNLGLRDVAALAEVLADAARAQQGIGDAAVLARYAEWRRRDNQVISRFTDALIRIFSNRLFPLVAARNAGLIAVDLMPPIKRGFVRVTSGLAGRLPRLARGLPL